MFRIAIIILFICCFADLSAQNVSLTFKVDMTNESVSPNGVHIAGTFQQAAGYSANWDPGITPLSDPDGDLTYELTVSLPPGTYLYKFVNGDSWGDKPELPPSECSLNDGGGNFNRQVAVGSSGFNLPAVMFDSCNAIIRFIVNLDGNPVSPSGLHVMGDFQSAAGFTSDWDPSSIELQDGNGDGTYEVEIQLPPGTYQYLYVNGNTGPEAESPPASCTADDGNGNYYRNITVARGLNQTPIYCYNSCIVCDPSFSTNYNTYWWNDVVFYEIFVRSFYDSDGDGIGDFQGLIQKLDYLNDGDPNTDSDLGIGGIWLMPIMESPSYHGYDATDYEAIDPDYGTMADFEEFIDSAHARGIKVILDFMMNHSSDQHPWFTQSANNQNNYRDWYVWSPNHPGFNGPWGQNVWHNYGGSYYYGLFWNGMPDLNFSHPPVKTAIFNATTFWMNKGADGFRLDAIKYLDEDGSLLENTPETYQLLEDFNTHYKGVDADAFTVGEVWSNTASIVPYVQNDRLDVCFEFDLAGSIINGVNSQSAIPMEAQIQTVQSSYSKLQYATFLTNHDMDRILNQMGADIDKMKQAAAIYLTLPGIPFVYYGEEIGMMGSGAHENIRTPMQWSAGSNAGFTSGSPWYGVGSNYPSNNVGTMDSDPNSLLSQYKTYIKIRNENEPLKKGYLLLLDEVGDNVISYMRVFNNEAVIFLGNLSDQPSSPQLTLNASSLTPGNYYVNDLLTDSTIGNLTINTNGGFTSWQPLSMSARASKVYKITQECPEPNIFSSPVTPTTAQLNWSNIQDNSGYQIRGKLISSSNWIYLDQATGNTQYNAIGLSKNKWYTWQLRTFCNNDADTSNWSIADTFLTKCQTPTNIWASDITNTSAKLNWANVPGALGYYVAGQKLGNSQLIKLPVNGGNSSNLNVNGLATSSSYYWGVQAVCNKGSSFYTSPDTFTTLSSSSQLRDTTISVQPNPVNNIITIRYPNTDHAQFFISNSKGNIMFRESLSEELISKVDVSSWATGLYIVRIGDQSKKFIILR
ncbi:MAG: T9SS type A sorting domain-containing protein [Chitinophagales bacterium]|nr:T9SS type A sorting domain-containing protein [Chitinophagales bacterium]